MNYQRFDRHSLFTLDMLSDHMTLIRDVQTYQMENDIDGFNFTNILYGVFDGFLYDELESLSMDYPKDIVERVTQLQQTIVEWIRDNQ
jgi:hypothetical protein